ncbi:hypothetical protein [Leptolyngbya ohadii]|uniref:hypothetical protein n=1 Tax=Leptolyngbya ohadii TaxID=1962290 RepID=UPI000B59CB19|nr:hypothetical protein [Leptolyngbya ohadii]
MAQFVNDGRKLGDRGSFKDAAQGEFNVELPLRCVFETPTIAQLAPIIDELRHQSLTHAQNITRLDRSTYRRRQSNLSETGFIGSSENDLTSHSQEADTPSHYSDRPPAANLLCQQPGSRSISTQTLRWDADPVQSRKSLERRQLRSGNGLGCTLRSGSGAFGAGKPFVDAQTAPRSGVSTAATDLPFLAPRCAVFN